MSCSVWREMARPLSSRRLRRASPGSPSCSTPTPRRSPNSSCARSASGDRSCRRRGLGRSRAVAAPVRSTGEIEPRPCRSSRAVAQLAGLIMPTDSFTGLRSKLIADLAERHRLPAISAYENFAKDGGLPRTTAPTSTCSIISGGRRVTSTASSRARSPATCRCSGPTSTRWWSISGPPRRSGSTAPLPLLGLADEVIRDATGANSSARSAARWPRLRFAGRRPRRRSGASAGDVSGC